VLPGEPPPDDVGRILVVMPAFNEQDSIAASIADVRETNPHVDLLVVDDGSSDATAAIAEAAGVAVCQLPFNLVVGGAMRTGYRYAVRNGYDVVVQIDADGQHHPRYLGDTVESTVIALRAGCKVAQVPVQMRIRQGGRASQTPVRAALYLARAVVALTLALVREWPQAPEPPTVFEEPT